MDDSDKIHQLQQDLEDKDDLIVDMKGCARCEGEGHPQIRFKKLTHPVGDLTHWAPCPTNGEPILLKQINIPTA